MAKISKRKASDEASVLTQRTKGEKILFGIVGAIFFLYSLTLLYPLFYLVVNSFQDGMTYILNKILPDYNPFALPDTWEFSNYLEAFQMSVPGLMGGDIYLWEMVGWSLYYSVTQVIIPVMSCTCVGYVLSKYEFKGKELIYTIIIFTMTIPTVGTQGSSLKLAYALGTFNNPLLDLITHFTGTGLNFMVMYAFFKNISWSYAEAVFIDGGGEFTAFFKVMLPQAKNAIVTLCIITFITVWNNYERPMLYFPDYLPLAAGLYHLKQVANDNANRPLYFAGLVISTIPLVVVYGVFSDMIFKNFSVGGLKG